MTAKHLLPIVAVVAVAVVAVVALVVGSHDVAIAACAGLVGLLVPSPLDR